MTKRIPYVVLCIFIVFCIGSGSGASDVDSTNRADIDTNQPIYKKLVQLYEGILNNQDNKTALQNISINLNIAYACLDSLYSDDIAEQYDISAKSAVYNTKEKVKIYFGKYLSALHGTVDSPIEDSDGTCQILESIVDPTVPAMTYEELRKVIK